jgi:L-lactate dehydrogenase (cytochrome)
MMRDRDFMARMIDRCKAAKCSALVLTLDLQVIGQRHKDLKNGLTAPPKPTLRQHPQPDDQAALVPGHAGHAAPHLRQPGRPRQGRERHELAAAWTNEQFDPR